MNISELFISASKQYPTNLAIIESNTSITFEELREEVVSTASYFQDKGIERGDRVLVFVPMSIDLYRVVLALFYVGATAVFLDEWVTKKRMEICCEIADCKGFIGVRKANIISLFSKELRKIPVKLSLKQRGGSNLKMTQTNAEDSALITFTTGSTGTPKAANRTHGFLKEQFDALIDEIEPSSTDIDMPVLPIVLFVNLGIGCTSVIAEVKMKKLHKLKTEKLINQIKANNVSRITASPSLINKLSEFVLEKKIPLSSIQKVFTGGGPVFPDEAGLYLKAFPNAKTKIVYGSTEAEPISSINAEELVSTLIDKGLAVGNIYHKTQLKIIPFEDNVISVKTDYELEKRELGSGKKGEIIVAGNHVLKSYFNNQKAFERNKIVTHETTWHRTGDSGFIQNGKLFLIGRCEQIIQQNGKTYSPFVIEHQLKQIEGITLGTVLSKNNQLNLVVESNLSKEIIEKKLYNFDYENLTVLKKIPRDPRHNTKIDYGRLKLMV